MATYLEQRLKCFLLLFVSMLSCAFSKADPIKDSIAGYINTYLIDTAYSGYKGITWKWTDTVYTSFDQSPEGAAILHRAEILQSETDSLNAVIAIAKRNHQPGAYIDSLQQVVVQKEKEQKEIFDLSTAKAGSYIPTLHGYKMVHTLSYKNDSGRRYKMTIVFMFDSTYRIIDSRIVTPFDE